ncbi:hypothetical protein [Parasphingorhabdus sp.]|uniref:hypothetical protein n=1 Tax=Parasphingorhabdus sp. TaxID=2709688 RepID=UPI002F91E08A
MKTLLIMTAPLLCLLSACSEEADAPVREDAQPENVEMPPQPDISQPMTDDMMTEEEADAALNELEAQQRALTDGAETGEAETGAE